jgi:hypothetical protein
MKLFIIRTFTEITQAFNARFIAYIKRLFTSNHTRYGTLLAQYPHVGPIRYFNSLYFFLFLGRLFSCFRSKLAISYDCMHGSAFRIHVQN